MANAKQLFKSAYRAARQSCRRESKGGVEFSSEYRAYFVSYVLEQAVFEACGCDYNIELCQTPFHVAKAAARVLGLEQYHRDHAPLTLSERLELSRDTYAYN